MNEQEILTTGNTRAHGEGLNNLCPVPPVRLLKKSGLATICCGRASQRSHHLLCQNTFSAVSPCSPWLITLFTQVKNAVAYRLFNIHLPHIGHLPVHNQLNVDLATPDETAWDADVDLIQSDEARGNTCEGNFATDS